jgi:putative cell wall-binding protein
VYRYTRTPQASPVDATSVTVTWAPPAFPRGAIGYTATATDLTTTSNGGQTCSVAVSSPESDTCTVTGLAAGDSYTFTVTATNSFGTGAPSAPTNPVTVPTSGGTGGGDIPPAPVPPAPVPPATAPTTTTVTAGGMASSSPQAHPTADNPVIASVQSPVPGTITFTPVDSADPQTGYTMLSHSFVISAPAATPDKPLQLSFAVDTSALPSGAKLSDLTVFRDGVPVPECVGASGTASPDPCVASVTTASGAASVTVLSSHASTWTFGVAQPGEDRIGGANRYETAASVATAFGAANAVVVANGETVKQGFDALSASYLAGRAHAPILLTAATSLPPATAAAVKQVLSGSAHPVVYVMGGKDSVSDAVAAALKTAAGGSKAKVIRVAGVSRYDTSVAAVTAMAGSNIGSIRLSLGSPLDKTAILASGVVNADALAAGALSAAWGIPVLLTGSNALPASIAAAIKDLKITQLIVLGGTDRVSAGAVGQAKAAGIASVKRIAGADRYATAAGLYAFVFDTAVDADGEHYGAGAGLGAPAYLANGVTGFPDALSVGPLAARSEAALLTTGPDRLATADARFLTAHAGTLTTVIALGKVTTLAAAVLAAAQKAIR